MGTYKNTIGRHDETLSAYLPKRIENRQIYFNPEFETFTYGDSTAKRNYSLKLKKGDPVFTPEIASASRSNFTSYVVSSVGAVSTYINKLEVEMGLMLRGKLLS